MLELFDALGLSPAVQTVLWAVIKITVLLVPLMVAVAYLTFAERKVIGAMQVRTGPLHVGYHGLLQPIADALKLIFKEIVLPAAANRFLFILRPTLAMAPALAAWAVVPFGPRLMVTDINAGILYILAITSMGVYGIIIAG